MRGSGLKKAKESRIVDPKEFFAEYKGKEWFVLQVDCLMGMVIIAKGVTRKSVHISEVVLKEAIKK